MVSDQQDGQRVHGCFGSNEFQHNAERRNYRPISGRLAGVYLVTAARGASKVLKAMITATDLLMALREEYPNASEKELMWRFRKEMKHHPGVYEEICNSWFGHHYEEMKKQSVEQKAS